MHRAKSPRGSERGQVIMLIINFEIFVLIVQKISAKLLPGANKSNTSPSVQDFYSTNTTGAKQKPRTNPTLRLAKATLTLIPVMGMQNLIFILIPSQGLSPVYRHPRATLTL